jgi:hypothetical protein
MAGGIRRATRDQMKSPNQSHRDPHRKDAEVRLVCLRGKAGDIGKGINSLTLLQSYRTLLQHD